MNVLNDEELVCRARLKRDRNAFGELVKRHFGMAERVAAGMVRDREVARDLAQEAFLQAYLSLDRLHRPDRFQSCLHGIVLNVSRAYLRSKRMTDISVESFAGGSKLEGVGLLGLEPDPQEVAEAQELRQAVRRAVSSLSPKNRSATLLFYYQQRSLREIAATLNLSVAAIKSRLHRSREDLRELLSPVLQEAEQPELVDQEEFPMTKVTIADLIEGRGSLVVALLLEESNARYLSVWMGKADAEVIASGLKDVKFPRPMTMSFVADILKATAVTLEDVRVEALDGDTFLAIARFRAGGKLHEVDCRPSDAIGLAVHTRAPIYVADELMDKAGKEVPEEARDKDPRGDGIQAIADRLGSSEGVIERVFGVKSGEGKEHQHANRSE